MEINCWGIHAGKHSEADRLFLDKGIIALGWAEMGDLSALGSDRDSFKVKVKTVFAGNKYRVANHAGQLFRFVHELKIGEYIIYPSKSDRNVYIGKVTGEYEYKPEYGAHPQTRTVTWLKHFPRTKFSQGALYEIGSAISFFRVKTYAEEFLNALEGKATQEIEEIDEVAVSADEIEQQTRDYVLRTLSSELKGLPLEGFIKNLFEAMGYQARLARKNEASVDLLVHKDELGVEPPLIKVQVKSGDSKSNDKEVSALYGKLDGTEFGVFVALGDFTPPAMNFAANKMNLRLIDSNELVEMIFKHYEKLDSNSRAVIPMRSIYVPE